MKANKVLVVKSLLVSISLLLIPTSAISAPRVVPGTSCKVQEQSTIYLNKTYTCIKSGKRLVWSKGVAVFKPIPIPTPTSTSTSLLTYSQPSVPSDPIELCKIKEASQRRWFTWAGFPETTPQYLQAIAGPVHKTGTVKWALIPVDFADLSGDKDWRPRIEKETKLLSEWFEIVSEGKFKVEWVISDKWVTLPGLSTDYTLVKGQNSPGGIKFFKTAMTTADSNFDFTNIQSVNFILPSNQNIANEGENGFPWDQHVKDLVTNEGRISSFTISGKYQTRDNKSLWNYWVHEFGHAIGLPHIGSSQIVNSFHPLDIMGNQDGYTRELSGWLRFVAGWLDDAKVHCQEFSNLSSSEITLVPISDRGDGIKMVVIPITNSKSLIIESRRETKFSCTMPTKRDGVLAYIYNSTLGHGENFLIPFTPEGRQDEGSSNCSVSHLPNPLLYKGQKIDFEGVTIEILDSMNYDKIRITKKS